MLIYLHQPIRSFLSPGKEPQHAGQSIELRRHRPGRRTDPCGGRYRLRPGTHDHGRSARRGRARERRTRACRYLKQRLLLPTTSPHHQPGSGRSAQRRPGLRPAHRRRHPGCDAPDARAVRGRPDRGRAKSGRRSAPRQRPAAHGGHGRKGRLQAHVCAHGRRGRGGPGRGR